MNLLSAKIPIDKSSGRILLNFPVVVFTLQKVSRFRVLGVAGHLPGCFWGSSSTRRSSPFSQLNDGEGKQAVNYSEGWHHASHKDGSENCLPICLPSLRSQSTASSFPMHISQHWLDGGKVRNPVVLLVHMDMRMHFLSH